MSNPDGLFVFRAFARVALVLYALVIVIVMVGAILGWPEWYPWR